MTTTDPFDFTSLTCPLPDCDEDLHLEWSLSRPLFVGDLAEGDAPSAADAYVGDWRVLCAEGHVVLVPGSQLCPCGEDGCNHDVDCSDEYRTFRAYDLERLRRTLDVLAQKAVA